MNKHVYRILVLTLGLLVLSCSRSAAPNGGGGPAPSPSSKKACSLTNKCSDPTETCDFLFPVQAGGTDGTCRKKCVPGVACANDGDVCNPITGACDTSCAGQVPRFCGNHLPTSSSVAAVCVKSSSSYCAFVDSSPGTGACTAIPGLKGSGGFCKVACSGNADCVGPWQACDGITGTCEATCDATQITSTCTSPSYTPSGSLAGTQATTVSLACSPVTATCVPSCTPSGLPVSAGGPWPSSTCAGERNVCYVQSNSAGNSGSCEQSCAATACGSNFQCAEAICQQKCTTNQECANNQNGNGKTNCDLVSQVCRQGCTALGQGSCPTGTFCSNFTATCVPGCTSTSNCVDKSRAQCYVPYGMSNGTCEQPSSSCTASDLTPDVSDSICAVKCAFCASSQKCPDNYCVL